MDLWNMDNFKEYLTELFKKLEINAKITSISKGDSIKLVYNNKRIILDEWNNIIVESEA